MHENMPYAAVTGALMELFVEMLPLYVPKAHGRSGTKVRLKDDDTPVTDLDNYTLSRLRNLIAGRFPEDITIGEEDKKNSAEMARILADEDGYYWTIDGLDGTFHFIRGTNSYGAMVSRRRGNRVLYAAIFRPVDMALRGTGFFVAVDGYGAWEWCTSCDEYHQLITARHGSLERTTVFLEGSSKKFFAEPVASLARTITTRPGLSSCIAATIVAQGGATALVTRGNKPWDTWPVIGIIEGAGGVVTNYRGEPRKLSDCGDMIAAASAEDIPELVKLLNP
jgi:fructose-1,6-bisphosphatase/inositol monophosphatase family enzyme